MYARVGFFLVSVLLGACAVEVDFSVPYGCTPADPMCPGSQVCVDNLCMPPEAQPGDLVDAAGGSADAASGGPTVDAAVVVTPPDATPPAPDAQTTFVLRLSERADATTSNVTTDAYIDGVAQTSNAGSAAVLEAHTNLQRRALLRFDLASVPAGAVVLDARLRVYVESPQTDGFLELAPLQQAWDEHQVTWRQRTSSATWTTQGGTAGSPVATFTATTSGPEEITLPLATVAGWLDAPASNLGLRIVSKSPTGKGALLSSKESAMVMQRPELVLTVEVQPAP